MTGAKTNERPGVRAQHRHAGMSATKARLVLDLIRGKSVAEARTILQFSERGAAEPIAKVLDSAVANAANNNDIPPEELFVATASPGPRPRHPHPQAHLPHHDHRRSLLRRGVRPHQGPPGQLRADRSRRGDQSRSPGGRQPQGRQGRRSRG